MKVHMHEEQFDGALHAACCRLDADAGDVRIVDEEQFAKLPEEDCCKVCFRIEWPYGKPSWWSSERAA